MCVCSERTARRKREGKLLRSDRIRRAGAITGTAPVAELNGPTLAHANAGSGLGADAAASGSAPGSGGEGKRRRGRELKGKAIERPRSARLVQLLRDLLLDLLNRVGRVEVLRARIRAVHDRVASVELEGDLESSASGWDSALRLVPSYA